MKNFARKTFFHFVIVVFFAFVGCKETVSPEGTKIMYNSVKRRIISQSMVEKTLVAATDLTLTADANYTLGVIRYSQYNHLSNISMHDIGLFSNFADGLVFQDGWASNNLTIGIRARRLAISPISGTTDTDTYNVTNKIADAVGGSFTTETNTGDVLCFQNPGGGEIFPLGIIKTITDDNNIELTSFKSNLVHLVGLDNYFIGKPQSTIEYKTGIVTLNEMYDLAEYVNPADLTGSGQYVSIEYLLEFNTPSDVVFSRDAISSDYDGDDVFFNIVSTLEYTPGN